MSDVYILQVCFIVEGYIHVEKTLKMAMQKYTPSKIAYILFTNKILSSVNYYIMMTIKNVPKSCQSSALLKLMKRDIVYLPKYRELIKLVKTKNSLTNTYSKTRDIG